MRTNLFVSYYSQDTHAQFMTYVWTNNAWIAIQVVAGGITGFYPAFVLWGNAGALAQSAAIVIHFAGPGQFFAFISSPFGIRAAHRNLDFNSSGTSPVLGVDRSWKTHAHSGTGRSGAFDDYGCSGHGDHAVLLRPY